LLQSYFFFARASSLLSELSAFVGSFVFAIHTYTHLHTPTHTYTHIHTYTHTHTHTYSNIHTHTHTYTHMHTHTHTYTHIHTHTHTYTHTQAQPEAVFVLVKGPIRPKW
jgi:hypothetical protein